MSNEIKYLSKVSSDLNFKAHNRRIKEIPIWEKPLLTVVEAAKYFQIGENTVRRLTTEYKDKNFVLWQDRRVYIRRKDMEAFLDGVNEV